jgi:hypothetical protein
MLSQRINTLNSQQLGAFRETLDFGGMVTLLRLSEGQKRDLGLESSLGAGVFTLFDAFNDNLENFEWEVSGFLAIQFKPSHRLAEKVGFHHLSSYVGDEYLIHYGVLPLTAPEQRVPTMDDAVREEKHGSEQKPVG